MLLQPASPARTPFWLSPRAQIFLVGFLFKSFFTTLFLISIDLIFSRGKAGVTIVGSQFNVRYFPAISLCLLVCFLLSPHKTLPLALCFKLVPILGCYFAWSGANGRAGELIRSNL